MFHKEGYKILGVTIAICILINVLSYAFIEISWLNQLILAASIIMFLLILQFFRNPKIKKTTNNSKVISPANGKVVNIEEVYGEGGFGLMYIIQSVSGFTNDESLSDIDEFFSLNPVPAAELALSQTKEKIKNNIQWIDYNKTDLCNWSYPNKD